MIRDQIMQMAQGHPEVTQAVEAMQRQLATVPIVPEDMDEAIKLLEFVLSHPDQYPRVRDAAIKDGVVKEGEIPQQFNKNFIISLLIALYGLQDSMSQQMSRGGLAFAARKISTGGQGGDSELVHVNRREKEMLHRMGGAGTINPNTGLHEYKGIGSLIGAVLPAALSIILPGVGTAIGGALGSIVGGVGETAASILGGAAIGAGASALTGGNPIQGALMGGVGGGLGGVVGDQLGLGNGAGASAAGGSLVGAGANAVTGQNPVQGAVSGGLAGLLSNRPSNAVLAQNATPAGTGWGVSSSDTPAGTGWGVSSSDTPAGTGWDAPSSATTTANPAGSYQFNPKTNAWDFVQKKSNLTGQILGGLQVASGLYGALGGGQQQQQQPTLSAQQQAYNNRPNTSWDMGKLQRAASAQGMTVNQFISQNMGALNGGTYNMAKGGLSSLAGYADGGGSGRDDTIPAKLSDGEYVMDAETVALLGDGSSKEGARRLDAMRSQIRKQKGTALAKGKFSPDAKSPLTYLQGA